MEKYINKRCLKKQNVWKRHLISDLFKGFLIALMILAIACLLMDGVQR